jgi:uncharacterized protein (TIGR02246 family)
MGKLGSADESAVHAVVSQYASTWNAHDLEGMHVIDTDDVEWINVRGNHWRGKATVYKGHDTLLRTALAKTRVQIASLRAREIAPGVAIAVATMKFGPLIVPTGEELPYVMTIGSFILLKEADAWRITHFQNTLIDAELEHNDSIAWDETRVHTAQARVASMTVA